MLLTLVVLSFLAGVAFTTWRLTRKTEKEALPAGSISLPGPKGEYKTTATTHYCYANPHRLAYHRQCTSAGT